MDYDMIKRNIEKIDKHAKEIACSKIETWDTLYKLAVCYDAKKYLYCLLDKEGIEEVDKEKSHMHHEKF